LVAWDLENWDIILKGNPEVDARCAAARFETEFDMADLALGSSREAAGVMRRLLSMMDSRFVRYAVAPALVAIAFVLHLMMSSFSETQADLIFLVPAVLIAGALGGFGPGLLATTLCLALTLYFIRSPLSLTNPEVVTAAVFLAIGLGMSWFGEQLRRTLSRAAATTQDVVAREAHMQSILATIPDAMIIMDENGIIRTFSSAAERMFGYPAAEVIGCNVKLLMPTPYNEAHDGYLARRGHSGSSQIIGVHIPGVGKRKDGSTFPVEIAVGEMTSEEKLFYTAFVRDLTERHDTEARLKEMQIELVHISRLTAMGEMASALAHELNQPLSAIANYMTGSRRLLANSTDEKSLMVRQAIDKTVDQALRAGHIIRRLRDFIAHRESERGVESLKILIEEANTLALVGAKDLGVQVRFNLDPSIDLVLVDKVQIQQVLLNLIRNAIEAMEQSSRRVLTLSSMPTPDGMVAVEVTDTGSGISTEIAEHLFQPFITTKSHGMGVGLSISRTIIEEHGGKIWATPNPDGGTVFRFTLAAVTRDLDDAQ
jgi:two-component system sensor kinase FixL